MASKSSSSLFSTAPSSLPVSFVRFQSVSAGMVDDQRLRDYLHRLFDICYQISGMFFAHDTDLYHLKLNDDHYFITSFLQKILFENLNTLPSFRLRIVLRHFCRAFVEHYSSSVTADKEVIDELFLTFLDVFLPYVQQRLTAMWTNLLATTVNYQQGECSDEVIEECVCVLITRDFVDIMRYFIYKTSATAGQLNSSSTGYIKKKNNKTMNGHNHSESMCEESNGINVDTDQIDEWDEQANNSSSNNNTITNKLMNGTQEKMDYSDLFVYMMKMSRQSKFSSLTHTCGRRILLRCLDSPLALRLFTYVIKTLFECLTFPDAYCVNRFLPIIFPLTRLSMDIIDTVANSSPALLDMKFLFQCLLKALERHNENEGVNTNIISLIGHVYELWHGQYQTQLDLVLHQTIPQLNLDLLNTYKTRLGTMNNNQHDSQKKSQHITERERRDTIKNLLNPLLLSPLSTTKKEGLNLKS